MELHREIAPLKFLRIRYRAVSQQVPQQHAAEQWVRLCPLRVSL
jgi:hypothetical protein